MKYLMIAGHGINSATGGFDSGATGFIREGEHRYFADRMFPAMRKYVHQDDEVIFHSAYNVYSANNIVKLAKSYGKDTIVTEFHYDATSNDRASGGHVIIHRDFMPDEIDLSIRNVIGHYIGLAYPIHNNESGISGRADLRNVNATASGGVNYRLLELGFGTNEKDASIMLERVEDIARDLVQAITGRTRDSGNDLPVTNKLWRVQVGAYANRSNAEVKAKHLRSLGEETYIIEN